MGVQHLSPSATMLLSNPRVRSLVYWDNPRDSGIVCGSLLVCLLAVRYISLISVIGNLSLALVTATMSFRIYKSVLAAVNKNQEGHPFKAFLDIDIRIPEAQLTSALENAGARVNGLLAALKAIILVENIVESAKFAMGMYLVGYLGALMTGLTLVTLAWIGVFSLPIGHRKFDHFEEVSNTLACKAWRNLHSHANQKKNAILVAFPSVAAAESRFKKSAVRTELVHAWSPM